ARAVPPVGRSRRVEVEERRFEALRLAVEGALDPDACLPADPDGSRRLATAWPDLSEFLAGDVAARAETRKTALERDLAREKARLEPRYAELIYDGLWFSPLKQALDAFVEESQRYVTGEVRLHLDSGTCLVTGRRSDYSLYDYGLATYDAADAFRHEDSAGFVRLWGLGIETWAGRQSRLSS
ncbi:MAG: argininosuccinate synthase, partial [Actinobacteria bacterium]|nr:argininosuccinate synthase [Actinomycetota bacterium]